MPEPADIIFLGTPEFAVPALNALHRSRHRIKLVVTQPDRPKGRGRKLEAPPVRKAAEALSYPVIQPTALKAEAFLAMIAELKPDFLCVVAYGRLLPEKLLQIPRLGALNIHPSLLPKYRGPAPIQWAIINGESATGVTIMRLDAGMDSGDILLTEKEPIHPQDTAATLHDRLAGCGAELLITTMDQVMDGRLKPVPQDHSQATLAPMLKKSDGLIDWNLPAQRIDSLVRGLSPWPGAFTFFQGARLKIFSVRAINMAPAAAPGTIIAGFQDELRVAAGAGAVSILEIQSASGRRLPIDQFLRGFTFPTGARFDALPPAHADE